MKKPILISALALALALPPAAQIEAQVYPAPIFSGLTLQSCNGTVFGHGASPVTCGGAQAVFSGSGSAQATTAGCTAGALGATLAAAEDFVNGQGIALEHCGAPYSGSSITSISILPTSAGDPTIGPAGSTTYQYEFSCVDDAGGVGAAVVPAALTTGAANLGVINQTARLFSANVISWTSTCQGVAVWRSKSGGAFAFLGVFGNALDFGRGLEDSNLPTVTSNFIPATPPSTALADRLVTTIANGGGTASLTLGTTAGTTVASAYTRHDDTAALNTYLGGVAAAVIPAGTFNIEGITIPATVQSFVGAGEAATIFQGWSAVTAVLSATSMPAGFEISNLSSSALALGNVSALSVSSTSFCSIHNLNLSGNDVLETTSDSNCNINNISVPAWYDRVISDSGGSNNTFSAIVSSIGATMGSSHWVDFTSGAGESLKDSKSAGGTYFGVFLKNSNASLVDGNQISNSLHEGLHISQSGSSNIFSNNMLLAGTSGIDYCISVSDDGVNSISQSSNAIVRNYLLKCGISAVGVSGFGGSGISIGLTSVIDNIIISPNADTAANTPVIDITGTGVSNTSVSGNTFLNVFGANYMVEERTAFGTPDHTQVGTLFGGPTSVGTSLLIGTGSVALTAATSTHSTGM